MLSTTAEISPAALLVASTEAFTLSGQPSMAVSVGVLPVIATLTLPSAFLLRSAIASLNGVPFASPSELLTSSFAVCSFVLDVVELLDAGRGDLWRGRVLREGGGVEDCAGEEANEQDGNSHGLRLLVGG